MKEELKTNNFSITFATVNGSGSATANNVILKAIFKMGIPVSARNIFPSNIQGMPTWYAMRISKDGYTGRVEKDDILIAMNGESLKRELENLDTGGMLLYNQALNVGNLDKTIAAYAMPVDELVKSCGFSPSLNIYLANMVYTGTLAFLIGIDLEMLKTALDQHFDGKQKAVETNMAVIHASYTWAKDTIKERSRFMLEPIQATDGMIMLDGNTAAALGALYGGLQYAAWYPITPATGLAESLNEYIPLLRTDRDTGNTSCVVVQAEDELAAIGMVVGAGWAGLRAMTSTSGPGLCLMAEFLGLAYFAEVPIVVWDVQRVGPSTGMPTHTSQGDLTFSNFMSHGDKDFVILLPANIGECFEFGWKALDIAEQLQTPVIVLSDLELGMNTWMAEGFEYPERPIERGKVLWENDLEEFVHLYQREWGRYLDVDGDGIPYRTLPGNLNPQAPYFTRGTSHDEYAHYSENSDDWEENLQRLKRKFEMAKQLVPKPDITSGKNKGAIVSYGSTDMAIRETLESLAARNVSIDYMKIKALPFMGEVNRFIEQHDRIFVVENNRDGQMCQLLCLNYPVQAGKFVSVSRSNGLALSAEWITNQIIRAIGKGRADG